MSISRLAPARRVCAFTLRSFSTQSRVRKENVGEELQKRFRTFYEAAIAPRTNALVARASANFAELGGRLNHVTGYNEIQELKNTVYTREQEITNLRREAREAKHAYELAVAERSSCQRQVNDLLQRKSSWTEADVHLFTSLVRRDHETEQAESRAKERSAAAELQLETQFNELMRAILNRYHEEQIWSDKIRSASTYGSLGVMGLNLFIFILAILVVEPYKRKKLGETFEQRMVILEKENQALMRDGMKSLEAHFEQQQHVLTRLAAITTLTPVDHTPPPPPPPLTPSEEDSTPQAVYTPTLLEEARSIQSLRDAKVLFALGGAASGILVGYLLGR